MAKHWDSFLSYCKYMYLFNATPQKTLPMPLQTCSQKPQTPKKTAKPNPKPRATHKAASATKTPAKKKSIAVPSEVMQAYENGSQEITLRFSASGKST